MLCVVMQMSRSTTKSEWIYCWVNGGFRDGEDQPGYKSSGQMGAQVPPEPDENNPNKKEIKIVAITLFACRGPAFGRFLPRISYSPRRYLLMDGLWPRNALTSTDRGFAENFSAWFSQHVCRSTWTLHPLCGDLDKLHDSFTSSYLQPCVFHSHLHVLAFRPYS